MNGTSNLGATAGVRRSPSTARRAVAACAAGLAAVSACALCALAVRRRLAEDDVHLVMRSKFGPIAIYDVEGDDGSPVRVLSVAGSAQSATYLDDRYAELAYAYPRLYDLAFVARPETRDLLMVGGGGFAYPKHLVATRPEARIDVVEVDERVISLARRYFFLDRLEEEYDTDASGRLRVIVGDGREHLRECARDGRRYDAILNDAFAAGRPAASMLTLQAADEVHACLRAGGLYLTNVVSALYGGGARTLRSVVATLSTRFAHVVAVPCAEEGSGAFEVDNVMVIASDANLEALRPLGARTVATGPDDPVLSDDEARRTLRRLSRR